LKPANFEKKKWALYYDERDKNFVYDLVDNIIKASEAFGIKIEDPAFISIKGGVK
jgi:hypothetical protein